MDPVSLTASSIQTRPAQTVVAVLRAATDGLHQALHEHPLIVELLTHPSLGSYRAVLEGFHRFYVQAEPMVVECARKLGFAQQYPHASRTQWLVADLKSLGCECDRLVSEDRLEAKLNSVPELVGSLYVIKGSALGGRTILRQVSGSLSIERCRRFFRGEGVKTRETWNVFQVFCDAACRSDRARKEAIITAERTFTSIENCLTWSMKLRCSPVDPRPATAGRSR